MLVFALAFGCGDASVTEIFACYSIDEALAVPTTSARLRAEALPSGRTLFEGPLPGIAAGETQGFVQREADGVRLVLSAEVPDPDAPLRMVTLTQVAIATFSEGRVVDVSVMLEEACLSMPCPVGQTCVAGDCRDETLDVRCLRQHGDDPGAGCVDPRALRPCDEL